MLLLVVAVPLAWWIARPEGGGVGRAVVQAWWRCRWCFRRRCWGFICWWGWGRRLALGRVMRVIGHPLAFTFAGLVVGSMLYSLPFAVQPLVVGFAGSDGSSWRRRLCWARRR